MGGIGPEASFGPPHAEGPPPPGGRRGHRRLVSRLVRAPAARTPRAARTPAFPAAGGSLPDVEDRPRPTAHRSPRTAEAGLAGLLRPPPRSPGAHDARHDGPSLVGGDARSESPHPPPPTVPPHTTLP